MWHAGVLVRALATAQRHTCSAHIPVEGVAVALVSGLDSSGSPGALSVPRAHSSHPAALESSLRCSAAPRLYNHAVAAADHWILAGRTLSRRACAAATSELFQDHHGVIP